jgi:hypothetical protein
MPNGDLENHVDISIHFDLDNYSSEPVNAVVCNSSNSWNWKSIRIFHRLRNLPWPIVDSFDVNIWPVILQTVPNDIGVAFVGSIDGHGDCVILIDDGGFAFIRTLKDKFQSLEGLATTVNEGRISKAMVMEPCEILTNGIPHYPIVKKYFRNKIKGSSSLESLDSRWSKRYQSEWISIRGN